MQNENIQELKKLIRNFKLSERDYFSECMLIAQDNDSLYYKGGIFTCDKDATRFYPNISAFWVRSFYALIENVRLGDLFYHAIPLLRWESISSEAFGNQHSDLLKNYIIENIVGDEWAEKEAPEGLNSKDVQDAVNILNEFIISSVATYNEGYVSYFIIRDDIGLQSKWPK